MPDVNDQIRIRIESFVQELSELVRRAALESVSSALGGPISRAAGSRSVRGRRPGGGKRSAEELESMTSAVLEYLSKQPGRGVEDIARELQVASKELVLPIRKLVAAGQLTTEGQKRATKYFVADKSAADGKGRAPKARRGSKKRGRKASGGRS